MLRSHQISIKLWFELRKFGIQCCRARDSVLKHSTQQSYWFPNTNQKYTTFQYKAQTPVWLWYLIWNKKKEEKNTKSLTMILYLIWNRSQFHRKKEIYSQYLQYSQYKISSSECPGHAPTVPSPLFTDFNHLQVYRKKESLLYRVERPNDWNSLMK